jgi:hypothetical protein
MSVEEASVALGVRRRYIRDLLRDPLFRSEFEAAIERARLALKPEALGKLAEAMRRESDGTTADRRLQFDAAKEILGDAKPSVAVSIEAEAKNGTMSFLALVQASFSPEVEARARDRMPLEGHAIPEPIELPDPDHHDLE